MKLRRNQAIAIGIIFLLLCMTGCGRESADTVQQSDTEQYVSTELPEEKESPAENPVESPAEDSAEVETGEAEDESALKSYSEMTTAEKIKTLTVEGSPLPLPCKVEDMGEGLNLGKGVTTPRDTTICDLLYNGKKVGVVFLSEVSVATDHLVDMSTGYEDAWIDTYKVDIDQGDFEILGITLESTMEDVISLWGDPDIKTETYLEYQDINKDTGESIADISFAFASNGKMLSAIIETIEN